MKYYLLKRFSEPSSRIALVSASLGLLGVFGVVTPEQAVGITTFTTALIAGVPDKQHDSSSNT